tara:strand:- start:131 stop:361 length:231 start_codon:yes stop_codon:yes gene_type:complete
MRIAGEFSKTEIKSFLEHFSMAKLNTLSRNRPQLVAQFAKTMSSRNDKMAKELTLKIIQQVDAELAAELEQAIADN